MHVADIKVTTSWATLESYIGAVEEDKTYTIINNSPDLVYAVESTGTPEEHIIGAPAANGVFYVYKKGEQDLYLRNGGISNGKLSNLTVNKEG